MTTITTGAAVSHVGRVRTQNQDSGYAGGSLFVVADGMGGHAGGDIASAIAVRRIAETDRLDFATPQEAEFALHSAMIAANQDISAAVEDRPELTGMGTTVSAMVRVGDVIATAHIGDSRIYLLRDGELSQITNDHTFVQRLVETGRITPEEAAVHPRRSVLMRVLGDIDQSPEIDTSILGTVPGDRWMLCSDGLTSYVPLERILIAMSGSPTSADAAEALVEEALEHGAPDNVTAIVVDIDRPGSARRAAQLVGSRPRAASIPSSPPPAARTTACPALLLHPIRTSTPEASFQPESEDYLDALIKEDRRRLWRRRRHLARRRSRSCSAPLAGISCPRLRLHTDPVLRRVRGRPGRDLPGRAGHGRADPAQPRRPHHGRDAVASSAPFTRSQIAETISTSSLDAAETVVDNARTDSGG